MKFKRTKFTDRLDKELTTQTHKTGRHVYFKHSPGASLARMSLKDFTQYSKIRAQASGESYFWSHAEFIEEKERTW